MPGVRMTVVAAIVLMGCAGAREAGPTGVGTQALSAGEPVRAAADLERFVDTEAGFEIARPAGEAWQFAPGHDAPDGILVPVVVVHPATGAQVVVQITPEVTTPREFAERLAVGLRSKPGFATTVPASADDGLSSGFSFSLGQDVSGKVGISTNRDGRLFVLLATWPTTVPQEVVSDVEAIMGSLRPFLGHQALLQSY